MDEEVKVFLELMKDWGDTSQLVDRTHAILCGTYKNKTLKLGQPPDKIEGNFSYGPSNKECFITTPYGYNIGLIETVGFAKKKLMESMLKNRK